MKNRTFGDSQKQALPEEGLGQGSTVMATRRQHHPALPAMTLAEPLFQNLNHTSRFFVDYCKSLVLSCPSRHPLMSPWSQNGCALLSSSTTAKTISTGTTTAVSSPAPARRW